MAKKNKNELVITENSRSVAGLELPPIPDEHKDAGTIVLFYQYKEPEWTSKEHKAVLKKVIELGDKCHIQGRGRVAPEGLNCTLSGKPQAVRDFCMGLREMDSLFDETDFKLTDGVSQDKLFKSFSIRKTKELVAYGLSGEKAPSLSKFAGEHLEADAYHRAMMDKDSVIVDVRNHYESVLGGFNPPEGGAELIDPLMRNSIEFPKWLNDPATQKKLHGKKVLMYCTGGIRCERATALLNQMSTANPETLKPKAVYELRGGIERYVKTFPEGGFWKGKNYLFDRRMEQLPGEKSQTKVEEETKSKCCVCRQKCTRYRGKFKCSQGLCGVPVIVCDECKQKALAAPKSLTCELCKLGYKAPQVMPDLIRLKRAAESIVGGTAVNENESKRQKTATSSVPHVREDCLFLARLPLTVTKTKLTEALGDEIKVLHWLTDKRTGAFYGSCMVQLSTAMGAKLASEKSIKLDKKKIKVSFARAGEQWPPPDHKQREFPPVGC